MFASKAALLAPLSLAASAFAIDTFTETFSGGAHGWRGPTGFSEVGVRNSGSIDGSSYAINGVEPRFSDSFALVPVFRGASSYFTSSNAFFGNWLSENVLRFEISIRWQPTGFVFDDIQFFVQARSPFAAAAAISTTRVSPGQWQTLSFDMRPTANFQYSPSQFSYAHTFTNVTELEIGFVNTTSLHNMQGVVDVSIDNIRIITPCPADLDNGSGSGTPDGGVTIDDLLFYLQAYAAGSPTADLDDGTHSGTPDGGVTIDDLLYFLDRFAAGC